MDLTKPKGSRSGLRITVAGILMLALLAHGDDVLYRNDFSLRTSSNPIPATNVWHVATPYPSTPTTLCATPQSFAADGGFTSTNLLFSGDRSFYYWGDKYEGRGSCDGWFSPWQAPRVLSGETINKLRPVLRFDGDNPAATFSYETATRRFGVALHSLHNEFTNGQVKIEVDIRGATKWINDSGVTKHAVVSLFPVYDKYMDILAWEGTRATISSFPGCFGVYAAATDGTTTRPSHWESHSTLTNTTSAVYIGGSSANGWFRFVVTYDLDSEKYGGDVYVIKKATDADSHPTFETVVSTVHGSFADVDFGGKMTDATRGISGIGLYAHGSFNDVDANTITNKTLIDNMRVSWKAPGAESFETVYENDFSTRRYRTLSARRTTAGSYAAATATTNVASVFTGYEVGTISDHRLAPSLSSPTNGVQPVGLDGWRLLPYTDDNTSHQGVLAYGGNKTYDKNGQGGNMLCIGTSGKYCLIAQTLGTSYSSGIVRISADVRVPAGIQSSYKANMQRIAVGLGSPALYSADRPSLAENLAAGCGYLRYRKSAAVTNHIPYHLTAPSGTEPGRSDESASFTDPDINSWYRIDVAADMDAKTYNASITPLGAISVLPDYEPAESPIYSVTGASFATNVSDIGTFYLYGYGFGNATTASYIESRVCFDNLRVWHDGELVYENDFTTRRRTIPEAAVQRAVGYVADQYDRADGMDGWIRRNMVNGTDNYHATATVRDDGGNLCLALGREDEAASEVQVTHALGETVTKGTLLFSADLRPPSVWRLPTAGTNGFAIVSLGDAQMEQTEIGVKDFTAHRQIAFGFSSDLSGGACPYRVVGMTPVVRAKVDGEVSEIALCSGAEVVPGNWYRFAVSANVLKGTYDVRLYDMGAAHPAADAANGTLVATRTNLAFEHALDPDDGVSAFSIHAYGIGGALGNPGIDSENLLVDNIRSEMRSDALSIIIR